MKVYGEIEQNNKISELLELLMLDQIYQSDLESQDSEAQINLRVPQEKLLDLQGCKSYIKICYAESRETAP